MAQEVFLCRWKQEARVELAEFDLVARDASRLRKAATEALPSDRLSASSQDIGLLDGGLATKNL